MELVSLRTELFGPYPAASVCFQYSTFWDLLGKEAQIICRILEGYLNGEHEGNKWGCLSREHEVLLQVPLGHYRMVLIALLSGYKDNQMGP